MTDKAYRSFQSCVHVTYGAFFGFVWYFLSHLDSNYTSLIGQVAAFFSLVLFNALLSSVALGIVLGVLIFPVRYFLITTKHQAVTIVLFAYGLLLGRFLVFLIMFTEKAFTHDVPCAG